MKAYIPDPLYERYYRLYPYQQQSVDWLVKLYLNRKLENEGKLSYPNDPFKIQKGAIIGHAPGLGKTPITAFFLSWMYYLGFVGKTLLVVPKGLLFQWKDHLSVWCSAVGLMVYEGSVSQRQKLCDQLNKTRTIIVLTTYDLVCDEKLITLVFDILVLDEATEIRNSETRTYQQLNKVNALFRLALTGTPLMNRLTELFNLVDFVCPGFFGRRQDFVNIFERAITKGKTDNSLNQVAIAYERDLRAELSHIMFRLTKDEIKMPVRKYEILVFLPLNQDQQALYNQIKNNQALAFRKIALLRKVCDCYSRFSKEDYEMLRLNEINQEKIAKEIVFQKLIQLFAARKQKTIVFSEFTQTLDHYQSFACGSFGRIDGDSTTQQRRELLSRFSETDLNLMFLSIKTSSFGLNLQAARNVILLSPSWNPSVEEQAVARAFRLGQKRDVYCYRLLTEDSIEEKMAERQLLKTQLHGSVDSKELDLKLDETLYKIFEQSCQFKNILKADSDYQQSRPPDEQVEAILKDYFVYEFEEDNFVKIEEEEDAEGGKSGAIITTLAQLRKSCTPARPRPKVGDLASIFGDLESQSESAEKGFEFSDSQ